MKHYELRVTATAPLAIRSDHSQEGATGTRYIPGTTLVGGLASLHRLLYQEQAERDMFAPLFLNEQVHYSNLYPAFFDDNGLQGSDAPVYPLPKTAQSCKRHPGFRFPYKLENDAHGVRDTLIDSALFKLATNDMQRLKILRKGQECTCTESMDHFEGYYRRETVEPYRLIQALPERYTRLQTRTGIDREAGVVQDGILYNREVFDEGMSFWGQISLPDDNELIEHFNTFMRDIGPDGLLRLGTGRTRGMGKVTLNVVPFDEELTSFTTFRQRLADFNKLLHDRAHKFKVDTHPYGYFFALTLHAPLLLCDELLRYHSTITPATLEELLDHKVPGLTRLFYASSMRRVTGWQELWGTPRTGEQAIESGSVFLFACTHPPDEELLKKLFALEEQGIGKRCIEGFGRIGVSDQFHQHIQQEEEQPL